MSSDRFAFLKNDNNKKNEKNEKNEKTNKNEKSDKQDDKPDKTKNRFLNPSKKEEQKKDESTRFKDLISKKEDKKEDKSEREASTMTESNRFKDLISKESSYANKHIHRDKKQNIDENHNRYKEHESELNKNQNPNMFESSLNKHKFSIDNEEFFPTLTEDFDFQPVHAKQTIENIVNYRMLSEKIIVQSAFEEHLQQQEKETYEINRIDKALESLKFVKKYSDRDFHRDIIEKYTLEREIQKQRDIERSFNEWNERRIERLKNSDDYLYRWSEAKRNEMLYCIYTDGLDDYGDNDYSEEEEDISDFNVDLISKNKKTYSDFSNLQN